MRECPFCKRELDLSYPHNVHQLTSGRYVLTHYCDITDSTLDVCIDIYGETAQECLDKWNGVYEVQKSESL